HFNEPWIDEQRSCGLDGGVETLGLSNGQRHVCFCRSHNQLVCFRDRLGHRLFDEYRNAGREKGHGDVSMQLGWNRDGYGVDSPAKAGRHIGPAGAGHYIGQRADVEERLCVHRPRDLLSTRTVRIDDCHQPHAGKRRQDPGVMAPEMTDSDHRDAKAHTRPTMEMPASLAALIIASPSSISVLAASTDKAVAPATRIASIVATPTTGTSNRMS